MMILITNTNSVTSVNQSTSASSPDSNLSTLTNEMYLHLTKLRNTKQKFKFKYNRKYNFKYMMIPLTNTNTVRRVNYSSVYNLSKLTLGMHPSFSFLSDQSGKYKYNYN